MITENKKERRRIVYLIISILMLITFIIYYLLNIFNLDSTIAAGLLAGLVVALFETALRWIEEGK